MIGINEPGYSDIDPMEGEGGAMKKSAMMTAVWILPAMTAPAYAQVAPPPANVAAYDRGGEIVVTGARAREEIAQDVPVSVAVLGLKQIESLQAKNVSDLASIAPNLTITPMGSTGGSAAISIRGFSAAQADLSAEPGVAVYIDGVYQVVNKGSLTDLYDVERIEVLNGPQGAILGKSASAGALLITHSRPTGDLEGKAQFEYGSHDLMQGNVLLNAPIVDGKLAGKLYVGYRKRDGYFKNLFIPGNRESGEELGTVRGALLFTPTDQFEVYVTADYKWDRSDQSGARNVSGPTYSSCRVYGFCNLDGNRRRTTRANHIVNLKSDEHNIAAHVNWEPGSSIKISSITGYRRMKFFNPSDIDQTSQTILHLDQQQNVEQISQELRLTPQSGGLDLNGRLSWVLGAYYGHSSGDTERVTFANNAVVPRRQSSDIIRDGYAIFAQADFDIIDRLTVSFGARRSHDEVKNNYNFAITSDVTPERDLTQKISFNNTSFEGGLRYKFDDSKMVYARYAEGYRAGGFNGLPANIVGSQPYGSETTKGYEAGIKTSWMDGAFLLNIALFDVKFTGLQRIITISLPGGGVGSVTANAASAETKGFEIQSVANPAPGVTFRANFGYLDAKYKEYFTFNPVTGTLTDLSGQPLTFAPKYTAMVAGDYQFGIGDGFLGFNAVTLHAILNWRDDFEMSNVLDPVGHQPSYATVDASVGLLNDTGSGLSMNFYVKNLFDTYFQDWATAVGGNTQARFDTIGRTFGVKLAAQF